MKPLKTQSDLELSRQDIEFILERQRWKNRVYCTTCGGSGKNRVALTGCETIDFEKCTACRGAGWLRIKINQSKMNNE